MFIYRTNVHWMVNCQVLVALCQATAGRVAPKFPVHLSEAARRTIHRCAFRNEWCTKYNGGGFRPSLPRSRNMTSTWCSTRCFLLGQEANVKQVSSKQLQPALAARGGGMAALAAKTGMVGPCQVVEGRYELKTWQKGIDWLAGMPKLKELKKMLVA
mgnify:CR=1 FL=1